MSEQFSCWTSASLLAPFPPSARLSQADLPPSTVTVSLRSPGGCASPGDRSQAPPEPRLALAHGEPSGPHSLGDRQASQRLTDLLPALNSAVPALGISFLSLHLSTGCCSCKGQPSYSPREVALGAPSHWLVLVIALHSCLHPPSRWHLLLSRGECLVLTENPLRCLDVLWIQGWSPCSGSMMTCPFLSQPSLSVQWVIIEQGCFAFSMVVVPLYDTLGTEAITYIVNKGTCGLRVDTGLVVRFCD